jgi:hypothetical protein
MLDPRRGAARSLLVVVLLPALIYLVVRPAVGSDAAGLAIAGALPLGYNVVAALRRRRLDLLAALSSAGFAVACLVSLLADGSSLPLELHEAGVTFVLGVVLLAAALLRHPLPLGRFLHVPDADRARDTTLNVMVGGFLAAHAILHVALALTLSTADYVVAGRVVNLATAGLGALALYGYLRRARATSSPTRRPRWCSFR